jgi:NhaA family Na+:H+ antiporter
MSSDPTRSLPPEAWEPAFRVARLAARPLERFLRVEASSGIILLMLAGVAMVWANSDAADAYFALRELPVSLSFGERSVARSVEWIVNDILMTIFFFVVGMEIRREIHHGELSELRRAALPVAAAIGGMFAPAGLYLAFAGAPATADGWGVPMATDIAFALGVMALLGPRVPPALRVLLLALAVIDDLGAILVIAIFYSDGIQVLPLALAAAGIAGIYALQAIGARNKWLYTLPGAVVWLGIYNAGLHPTIAGVVIGLITPVRAWYGKEHESPAEQLIHSLHPWVAYAIMPLFALANAGVSLGSVEVQGNALSVASGVTVGLVLGKPLGVLLACALVVKLGVATLPRGIGFRELTVLGFAAGIGFTMALFIAQLAFKDPELLAAAKLAVLAASGVAAIVALIAGVLLLRAPGVGGLDIATTADEAESSTTH